jgi:L-rhamnose-H+ transport protein
LTNASTKSWNPYNEIPAAGDSSHEKKIMTLALGLAVVLFAGILQGTFILPMNHTRDWKWEHNWFVFSLLGMLILNTIIGFATIPVLLSIYAATPQSTLLVLSALGLGWGVGAILFGLGMDRLGMSLGYPIIMGLIAVLGGLIPFVLFHPQNLLTRRGGIYLLGTILAIIGIIVCSSAAARRDRERSSSASTAPTSLLTGLLIAISAGILSSLPNLGISMSAKLTKAGASFGIPPARAANAVWVLFFSMGFLANGAYCLWQMQRKAQLAALFHHATSRNIALIFSMAAMWIGSFYIYGIGTSLLGATGTILAWPLFICTSILIGNFWGLRAGEWTSSTAAARSTLRAGMAILLLSVVAIALVNLG